MNRLFIILLPCGKGALASCGYEEAVKNWFRDYFDVYLTEKGYIN